VRLFVALCAACLITAGVSLRLAALRWESAVARAPIAQAGEDLRGWWERPTLVFSSLASGPSFGAVALAPLGTADGARVLTALHCQRVHAAAGRGLCLEANLAAETYTASSFDADFRVEHTWEGAGLPSRTRVSPDGRYGAITVFVAGDSYAEGSFSTRTTLLDLTTGGALAELEQFSVWRDGRRVEASNFNFWGVTYARDSNRFYATLATGTTTYLVEGDVQRRQVRIVYEGVECPSLSPDGTRLAFKKRLGPFEWRFHILDLTTLADTPLSAETRSIDDQPEWLDNTRIAYGYIDSVGQPDVAANVWVLAVDQTDPPRILVHGATSPAALRGS
jgi:hypothetical protein